MDYELNNRINMLESYVKDNYYLKTNVDDYLSQLQ
jgi:hypothetical protein